VPAVNSHAREGVELLLDFGRGPKGPAQKCGAPSALQQPVVTYHALTGVATDFRSFGPEK